MKNVVVDEKCETKLRMDEKVQEEKCSDQKCSTENQRAKKKCGRKNTDKNLPDEKQFRVAKSAPCKSTELKIKLRIREACVLGLLGTLD